MHIIDDNDPAGSTLSPALALCAQIVHDHIWATDEHQLDPRDGQAALDALVAELAASYRPVRVVRS